MEHLGGKLGVCRGECMQPAGISCGGAFGGVRGPDNESHPGQNGRQDAPCWQGGSPELG